MRLKRLDLKAFGPFTNRSLPFDSRAPGLHIIFGPNEAGKSSSLRALKALLYGFHQQTPDNFLHSYDQLLVGGCLENSAGDQLFFQRRKRRIGDIIDADGNPLDQSILAPFLHGVEPEIFESLYGIDHETLVRGGEEILAQKGEVGQALFAAGAGISSLREVIDHLEQEAAGLFKSTGKHPEINQAIKRFKELLREVKEASLSSKDWKDLQKTLKDAESERDRLKKDRDLRNKELRRLERLEQAIPELASLKVWQERLEVLGEVPVLPPDIGERHQQLDQAIREAKTQLQKDTERLKQIEVKRQAISLNKVLLKHAEVVDDFHQRLGEYRKGQKDRPVRDGMRINLRKDAASFLKQVRPDLPLAEAETLRPVLFRKRTVQALSGQYAAINQQLTLAGKRKKEAEQELREMEQRLAAMPAAEDDRRLLQAVKLAQKAGTIDAQLEKGRSEVAQDQKECRAQLKRIGLWSGELTALMELALPLSETVKKFEKQYGELTDERRGLEKERKEAEKELQDATAEVNKVEYAGEIPSEEELIRTREKREQGWQLLRRQWIEQQDVTDECLAYEPGQPLFEAYERYVRRADRIADRLRREAERVANAAALRAKVEKLEETLEGNDRLEEALELRTQKLEQSWTGIWEPLEIIPLSPKEMSDWLAEIDKLRYRVAEIFKKELDIKQGVEHRHHLRQALLKEIKSLGEEQLSEGDVLAPLLVSAETVLDRIAGRKTELEKLKDRQEKAQATFDQASEDFATAQDNLSAWREEWRKALAGLGLKDELSTLEAADSFEALQSCFDKLKEAGDLQKRIDGIDRDADELEKELKALLQQVAPEMLTSPPDQAILQLRAALVQAQKDSTLYDQLSEEYEELQDQVSTAEKTLQAADEQLAELLRIAKCEKPEELGAIIGRFMEHQKIQEKGTNIEATLAKIGAGAAVDELAAQAAEVDANELPGRIVSLRQEIEEKINPEIIRISEEIGKINDKLKALDGSGKAAESKEKIEQELTRIRRLAERYVRLKLASKVLQQEIERYREEHQDPVLKIAAGHFAHLTLGSFEGLKTDLDDKGQPILVGIRPGDVWVPVEGMSDGTRDQLYLALRLATLEWRLKTSEPMPFIVDDILVNFDDDRSRATLKVLADLSMKNQVILFTHHGQVVDAARDLTGEAEVEVHSL
jgi:uncharacterized protein YhaN